MKTEKEANHIRRLIVLWNFRFGHQFETPAWLPAFLGCESQHLRHDVHSEIAQGVAEVRTREGKRHPARTATDVDQVMVRLEAKPDEALAQCLAHHLVIAADRE